MVCRTVTGRFICTLAFGLGAILCPFCSGEGVDGSFRANISQSEPDTAAKNPPVSTENAADKVVNKAQNSPVAEIASLESKPVGGARKSTDSLLGVRKDLPEQNADIKTTSTWWVLTSLLLVLALIVVTAYLLRRFLPGSRRLGRSSAVEILSRSVINPRQSLCLVRLGNKLLLVGLSPNHMSPLASINDPEEIAQISGLLEKDSVNSISNTFGRLFHKESQGYDMDIEEKIAQPDRSGPEADANEQSNWREARGELSELLSKVKGLARMKFR